MNHYKLVDYVTTGTGATALVSPFWLPALKQASEAAGLLLPFFGLILIIVQIRYYSRRR